MEIRIESLLDGARRAKGTVVIVDVFRAFTTAAVALARGADRIVMVAEIDEALRLRDQGVGEICVGEVNGIQPEGFDFGNSPHEMMQAITTRQGGHSVHPGGDYGRGGGDRGRGSLRRVVRGGPRPPPRTIRRDNPADVTIVAMGWNAAGADG